MWTCSRALLWLRNAKPVLEKCFCSGVAETYRQVMSRVPVPVVVVTSSVQNGGQLLKRGVTCSSFTSVSLSPPLVSFSIAQHSRMHNILLTAESFVINVLSAHQVALGVHFANAAKDDACQFEHVKHEMTDDRIPILRDTSAALCCTKHSVMTVGDHHVWYGLVKHSSVTELPPLLYYSRGYRAIGDEIFIQAFEDRSLPFEDWTHMAHMRMAWNYIRKFGPTDAVPKIKCGIKRYNEVNKDKIKRGYHETVTIFYIKMVEHAISCHENIDNFEDFIDVNNYLLKPDLLFNYYSSAVIGSKEAASGWLEPDLKPLPKP